MIPDWQRCDNHGGYGFKSDCIICKEQTTFKENNQLKNKLIEILPKYKSREHGEAPVLSDSMIDKVIAIIHDDIYNNHETLQKWKEDIAREEKQRCIEVINKNLKALLLDKNDYTSIKRLVDIPATDYNQVINAAHEILIKALEKQG